MMLPVVMISCRTFFHPLFTHFEWALHVEWQIENCNVFFPPILAVARLLLFRSLACSFDVCEIVTIEKSYI